MGWWGLGMESTNFMRNTRELEIWLLAFEDSVHGHIMIISLSHLLQSTRRNSMTVISA